MMRWLLCWRLRCAQTRLQAEIDWLRDTIWTDQNRLLILEKQARVVQSDLWAAEAPRSLLTGRDSGLTSKR